MQVAVRDIASVGKVIDAEADAAATAAGGSLGALLELTIEPNSMPQPRLQRGFATSGMVGDMAAATPLETGELVVHAVVRVVWQFLPAQR